MSMNAKRSGQNYMETKNTVGWIDQAIEDRIESGKRIKTTN